MTINLSTFLGTTFQGNTGIQGAQGVSGFVGSDGAQGAQGIAGSGSQGASGSQGIQGTLGAQGIIGAGSQGASGSQGIQGTLGAQGIQGTLGSQGSTGSQGSQGTQGIIGAGSQGAQGSTGSQGSQGTQGVQGLSNQGVQGTQGLQGVVGDTSAVTASILFQVFNDGAALTTGIKGDVVIPFNATITEWSLLADQTGSVVVDIWKDTYGNYPPTVDDSITASAKPTITSSNKGQSSTLTGWTTTISAGDILRFNIDSVSTIERLSINLKITRT